MLDVIAFLIEHFQDFDACPPREDLGTLLEEEGFDDQDIGDILWFLDSLKQAPVVPVQRLRQSRGLRIYDAAEQDILLPEVCGLLHFLEQEAAINPQQREWIVHALLNLPEENMSVAHAKVLALLVLWVQKSELPVLIGDELMHALLQSTTVLN